MSGPELDSSDNVAPTSLPPSPDGGPADLQAVYPNEPNQLSHLARQDQARRWRQGDRCPAEEYLTRFPEICRSPDAVLDLIYHDYLLREAYQLNVSAEEYGRRFPDYAQAIADQIAFHNVLEEESLEEPLPAVIGNYEIEQLIGVGSFGAVYRARDRELDRTVAIKVPRSGELADPAIFDRFQREARSVAQLRHPLIVTVYGIGRWRNHPYLISEFVRGVTLADVLVDWRPTPREAAELIAMIADAVGYAHSMGVIHRDIKPSNIMLDEQQRPRIMDFGLARRDQGDATVTMEGQILGTPAYMSPEQARGAAHQTDGRTDVYSLGAILYQLLTGELPFGGTSRMILYDVIHREPRRPRSLNPEVPRDLETICLRAMAKDLACRYGSAPALADDLRRFVRGEPIHARTIGVFERWWRWSLRNPALSGLTLALAGAIGAAAAGITWKWHDAEQARASEQRARQEAVLREQEIRVGLTRLQQATALMERGRQYAEWLRWDDADRCLTRAILLRPDHAPLWNERGRMYSRLGLWDLAAADHARAFAAGSRTLDSGPWWSRATLLAFAGDSRSLQALMSEMRHAFRGTVSSGSMTDVARVRCLLPHTGNDDPDDWYVQLAEKAVKTSTDSDLPSSLYVAGLAHYRAGNFQLAVDRLLESSQSSTSSASLVYPPLAMAVFQLGQSSQARQYLDQAAQANDAWIEATYQRQDHARGFQAGLDGIWPIHESEFLEYQLLLREAHQLLQVPQTGDPRIHRLRGQALAGLNRRSAAEREFQRGLELRPDDVRIQLDQHKNRALTLAETGQILAAAEQFSAASLLSLHESKLVRSEALCRFLADDMSGYRRICDAMLEEHSQTTDKAIAHDVVEAYVVAPVPPVAAARLLQLADLAATWYADAERVRGAALYRAGRDAEAVGCFEAMRPIHQLRPWDYAFLAMALHRLNRTAEAQQCLQLASEWMAAADDRSADDLTRSRFWDTWYERPCAERLLAEAVSCLGGPADPVPKPAHPDRLGPHATTTPPRPRDSEAQR